MKSDPRYDQVRQMNTESNKAVLVSLVTYNDESFLARCLEAVQNHGYKPIRKGASV